MLAMLEFHGEAIKSHKTVNGWKALDDFFLVNIDLDYYFDGNITIYTLSLSH